jgi:DNA (cytosine-5)-methyltransferase 1
MMDMHGSDLRDAAATDPLRAITAGGLHAAQVAAFLIKYYGSDQDPQLGEPLHTATSKHRFGLVTVDIKGQPYIIVDIGLRMLTPRELFRAQGFPESYVIDTGADGETMTKTAQVRMCGNSVCPQVAEALFRANVIEATGSYLRPKQPRKVREAAPWEFPLWQEDAA